MREINDLVPTQFPFIKVARGLKVTQMDFLLLKFPEDKKAIAGLNMDQKMEWYAHQFQKNPGAFPFHLSTPEFQSFWKWRVLVPTKFKRFFYRLKTGQIFKRYQHISEMKKKVKPHSI